ncbi:MAG TPA: DUF1302 domain-containing protein [Vicinamibacteria bacterium]|nr:DUF1302 domain-containing protein [Vicinamibacteria bacterium]
MGLTLLPLLLLVAPAGAVDYQSGGFKISWGNTISYGTAWRVADRDLRIVGLSNGGTAFSVNGDDGNLNYDKGLVSNAGKLTTELELSYKNVGAFARGFGFYDYENEEGTRARAPLSEGALERVGSRLELRDAFVWFKFKMGPVATEIRAGDQVLSWGESTFIQNGINVVNPIDVSALRVPGSELREGLLPVGLVWASLGLSKNVSMELFYQYKWEETIIDPPGTYFSTADFAGLGGSRVMLGFGSVPDTVAIGPSPTNPIGAVVQRAEDRGARDDGQYGAALRFFLPALGGTEFGLYHVKYHSRLPVINATTGTFANVLPPKLNYAQEARYFLSYPEDIKLFGLSFNTRLAKSGIALQGEFSHRRDVPLQVDDLELLYASLTPLRLITIPAFVRLTQVGGLLAANNQLGAYGFSQDIQGFQRFNTSQFQMTATRIFGGLLWADQATVVAEAAVGHTHDFPEQSVLRLEGPGTYVSGNSIHQTATIQPSTEPASAFPDATAWGYQLAGRLEYNNAIKGVNLIPRFSWAHDVSGLSPGPGGNFIEGRKALTVGLTGTFRISWEVDLSYTRFSGADRYNLINDRDFIATSLKFSF